jgi:Flp pilus assembly protein TadB
VLDPPITLREFLDQRHDAMMAASNERHLAVMRSLEEIKEKQDETNGRVRKAEQNIAVLSWAYGLGVVVIGWIIYKLP